MSYQKTIWQNGDIITAQKLNHIEESLVELSPIHIKININDSNLMYLNIEVIILAKALRQGCIVYCTYDNNEDTSFGGFITSYRVELPNEYSIYYRYTFFTNIKPSENYRGTVVFKASGETSNVLDYPIELEPQY